ncbi:MAG: MBL fold metallo-hydrolase [Bacillota bacterium]
MQVEWINTGAIGVNTYIVWTEGDTNCILIDPGAYPQQLDALLGELGLTPEYVVLTHGHFDHIGGVKNVKDLYGAKIMIHALDKEMLVSPEKNLSNLFGFNLIQPPADVLLGDGDVIQSGNTKLKVLHTQGHSPGGICLTGENIAFTGDTLFQESIGRTDFPGADYQALLRSIDEKLMALPDDTRIYPGHGEPSDIGHERRYNTFLKRTGGNR